MDKQSLTPAFAEGFKLMAREPLSVLVWGVLTAILSIGPVVLMFRAGGPDLISFYGDLYDNPTSISSPPEAMMRMQSVQAFQYIGMLALYAIVYPAIWRAVLHPQDRGFAYLRFSKVEGYMALLAVLLYVLLIVGVLVAMLLGGLVSVPIIVAGVMSQSTGTVIAGIAVAIAAAAAMTVGFLYVFGRLGMAGPMIVATGKLTIFEGWVFTRGYGWAITGVTLLIWLIVLLIEAVIGGAALAAAMAATGGTLFETIMDREALAAAFPTLVLGYGAVSVVMLVIVTPILMAPQARMYQIISAADDSNPAVFN